jgi:hypothetical protein
VSSTFLTSKVCGFQSRVCRNSFEWNFIIDLASDV